MIRERERERERGERGRREGEERERAFLICSFQYIDHEMHVA